MENSPELDRLKAFIQEYNLRTEEHLIQQRKKQEDKAIQMEIKQKQQRKSHQREENQMEILQDSNTGIHLHTHHNHI